MPSSLKGKMEIETRAQTTTPKRRCTICKRIPTNLPISWACDRMRNWPRNYVHVFCYVCNKPATLPPPLFRHPANPPAHVRCFPTSSCDLQKPPRLRLIFTGDYQAKR